MNRILPFVDPSPAGWRTFFDSVPLYRADDDAAFWPADRLQSRRDELLARQMGWVAAGSRHYREKFEAAGVDPEKVRGTDDLQMLPVTTKAELMADPESFRLQLPDRDLHDMTYATVYTTGTTTGRPTPYEYTTHDFLGVLLSGRRTYKHLGLKPGDSLLTMFPLSPLPHVSGFAGPLANAAGLVFAHGLTGMDYPEFPVHRPTSGLLQQLRDVRPDAVAGIASFLRRIFAEAAEEGADLSSVKVVIASGEVLTARMRERMKDDLARCGASQVFIASTYGFTEGGVSWVPSGEDGPLYATAPDQVFLEIVQPETHERLPDGEPGLVTLTHLNRRGMPLVRYVLGDISALTHEVDPRSGRGGEGLLVSSGSAHVSRTTDLFKVKGTLVNPQLIHEAVMNTPGIVEYQVIVTNAIEADALSPERLIVRLGLAGGVSTDDWTRQRGDDLRRRVRSATEVTPDLEFAPPSEIYDPERDFKARRFVDRRPKE